ncbi:hypothetical protein C8J56DRAFT_222982 [Mycena floridula]|nr:hypothetical protein C8J56DRAFT_222982 [Mycena floridula]
MLVQNKLNSQTLHVDLRFDPHNTPIAVALQEPGGVRPMNYIDSLQLAVMPARHTLRLVHPLLPWHIDILSSTPSGITICDIVVQIHQHLMQPITGQDFTNDILKPEDREEMTKGYSERCIASRSTVRNGMRRLDFLKYDMIFCGLELQPSGICLMKTKAAQWPAFGTPL